MARLLTCGWETGTALEAINLGQVLTLDTTTVRTGGYSIKAAGGVAASSQLVAGSGAAGDTWYGRVYIYITGSPSAATGFFGFAATGSAMTNGVYLLLNTDRTVALSFNSGTVSPASSPLSTNTWYRIELRAVAGTSGSAQGELVVNGVSVVSTTGSSVDTTFQIVRMGNNSGVSGTDIYYDDLAVNDGSGTDQASFPGGGSCLLLTPVADNAIGTGWTTSGGASTGLWDNVDNEPPTGIADTTSNAGHQIRNATSNANSAYDAQVTDYSTAGLLAADTVTLVHPIVSTGAAAATSAKQGTVGCVSNPAGTMGSLSSIGTSGAFWAGSAAGTFSTGWKWSLGPPVYGNISSGNRATRPVVRINQVTSNTRIALADFLGLYVDYTTGAVAPPPINQLYSLQPYFA